jgi:hypothetical protein
MNLPPGVDRAICCLNEGSAPMLVFVQAGSTPAIVNPHLFQSLLEASRVRTD